MPFADTGFTAHLCSGAAATRLHDCKAVHRCPSTARPGYLPMPVETFLERFREHDCELDS